jgi:hypothetical protein
MWRLEGILTSPATTKFLKYFQNGIKGSSLNIYKSLTSFSVSPDMRYYTPNYQELSFDFISLLLIDPFRPSTGWEICPISFTLISIFREK